MDEDEGISSVADGFEISLVDHDSTLYGLIGCGKGLRHSWSYYF